MRAKVCRRKISADLRGLGEIRGLWSEPDEAARFEAGQFDKAERGLVEAGERIGAGQREELAVGAVSPGMVGADEALGASRFAAFDKARAPVAADVHEHVRLACGVAREEQRLAGGIVGYGHARLRQQRGRGEDLRQRAEQRRLLARPVRGVGIDAGGDVRDAVRLAARA